jgi:hypothetical protein
MLFPALCQIAIAQKLRTQNFRSLSDVLRLALEAGVANSLLWDQAATVLAGMVESATADARGDV